MSIQLLDYPSVDRAAERPIIGRGIIPRSALVIIAVLSPAAMAVIAILLHHHVPNRQTAVPTELFPLLLKTLFLFSAILAAVALVYSASRRWIRHHAPLFAGAVLLLAVWDWITLKSAWLPLPFFPGPDMVLRGISDDHRILLISTIHSLRLLLVGYLAGSVAGFVTGLILGWSRVIRYWGMPFLKIVGPVPATAFIPLAMVIFTNSFFAGASIIALAAWFPMTVLTMSGIANTPLSYLDVAQTWGAKHGYLIFRVAIPSASSNIFVGLFIGLAASFLTLIAAETVGVKDGLGWYLKWQQGWGDYAKVYGAMVIMAVFFSSIMTLLFKARDWVMVWQKGLIRW